ncbi:MAG: nucleotidyltransferase [Deltaproteobacteria bacterium RBG_13_58_19]|nr:MAG: nucleotidyltransferase [Deltaproteobacteria bacterium RBG_13_58_19]
MRDDREKLLDILEAIGQIVKYAERGPEAFANEELIQVWIVHHLRIIGEASRSLSAEIREKHGEVPWSQIISLRNLLVHHYFGIDLEVIRDIVKNDLPPLKRQVESILQELGGP